MSRRIGPSLRGSNSGLVAAGLLKGRTIAIDATTLEANAAMRSIVRRDTGESYQAFLTRLAETSGIKTPTREALARLDRKRKKKTSNKDWTNPHDPDAKVTKMKDGRTHLAHKAEHAVDLETGAIVAVTVQGADQGDTTTLVETATAAAEQIEDAQADVDEPQSLEEIIGDKGYHSNQSMVDLEAVGIRSYIAEPDRGRRDWSKEPDAQAPVYRNRRRMRGPRGRRLMRQRGERIERSFAHLYDTGGMRRTHLRGHQQLLGRDRRPTDVGVQPVKAGRQPREHRVGHLANRAQRMVGSDPVVRRQVTEQVSGLLVVSTHRQAPFMSGSIVVRRIRDVDPWGITFSASC